MIRAFIAKVDMDEAATTQETAVDIENALDRAGIPVVSVTAWKGHGMMGDATPPLNPLLPPTAQ